ncbi:inverted formin-2-like [Bolinopsis microptera]|uniref:inverted formin-2-like n=1 Tax=Bolinopsis microptera TaxID=2820187 RepID=UPI00307A2A2D
MISGLWRYFWGPLNEAGNSTHLQEDTQESDNKTAISSGTPESLQDEEEEFLVNTEGIMSDSTPEKFIDLIKCHPTCKTYMAAKTRFKSVDKKWFLSFLELDGVSVIFETLNVLAKHKDFSISDSMIQLDCVSLLKTILNRQNGLEFFLERDDYSDQFAHALTTNNIMVKKQIFELLSALCYNSKRGYIMALEALKKTKSHVVPKNSYYILVSELKATKIPEYSTTILALVNTILVSTDSRVERNNIRTQLASLHLPEIIEKLRSEETDDDLLLQLETYVENEDHDGKEDADSYEDLDSTEFILSKVYSKMQHLPERDHFHAVLQNLLVIEPNNENFAATWLSIEQLTNRAIENQDAEQLDSYLNIQVEKRDQAVGTEPKHYSEVSVQTEPSESELTTAPPAPPVPGPPSVAPEPDIIIPLIRTYKWYEFRSNYLSTFGKPKS